MTSPEPWDDDRLSAAFAAYAGSVPPPGDLVGATTDALRARRPAGRPWWRRPVPALLAGAAAVYAVVLGAQLLVSMQPSEPATSAGPSGVPSTVLDLPVVDVETAIGRRDAGEDDGELAVRGWFSPVGIASCPEPHGAQSLLLVTCPGPYRLTRDPESAVTVERNGVGTVTFRGTTPTGPSLELILRQVDTSWIPALPERGPATPVEVVLVGHVDDDRAAFCPVDEAQACRDRFVVDRVVWADGQELPRRDVWPEDAKNPTAVVDTVAAISADNAILGVTFVSGPEIRPLEPAAPTHPDIGARDGYWIVSVLEQGRARRYVGVDGWSAIYRVDGMEVTYITGTPPGPDVPLLPNDDDATIEPIGDVRGGWMATFRTNTDLSRTVTIVDRTGTLLDVRLATDDERTALPLEVGMHAVALDPTTTLVGWSGSLCELAQGLEVTDPDGARRLTLIGYADALCRAAEVTTALVMVWSEPVGDVRVTDDRSAHAFPTAVAGLATQPVSVALPIRDADDAREVAIKGWLTLDPRSDCGDGAVRPLLDPGCQSYARTGVLSDADGTTSIRFVAPNPEAVVVGDGGAPVVLVGHFDDRRAVDCPDVATCRDTLVVDAVWAGGRLTTGAWQRPREPSGPPPRATRDLVDQTIQDLVPGPAPQILGVAALDGDALAELEPITDGTAFAAEPWTWHVTVLVDDQVRTYLLEDDQLLERQAGRSWTWHEIVGDQITSTAIYY